MDNRELDRHIAEIILDTKFEQYDRNYGLIAYPDGTYDTKFIPYYSTQANDSYQLKTYLMKLGLSITTHVKQGYCKCVLTNEKGQPLIEEEAEDEFMALCIATLKWWKGEHK